MDDTGKFYLCCLIGITLGFLCGCLMSTAQKIESKPIHYTIDNFWLDTSTNTVWMKHPETNMVLEYKLNCNCFENNDAEWWNSSWNGD